MECGRKFGTHVRKGERLDDKEVEQASSSRTEVLGRCRKL